MSDWERFFRGLGVLILLGASAIAVAVGVGRRTSTIEIISYQAAVYSQSRAEALRFISTFSSSHLVADLVVSLKPEVAEQVCADLQGGGPRKAQQACEVLHQTLTAQRSATANKAAPAVDIAIVSPVSAGGDASAGVASDFEPRVSRDAG